MPAIATHAPEAKASDKEPKGCCGGPAPAGVDACCVKDADAKASGDGGCGCGCGSKAG